MATVLTFDIDGITNGANMPQAYGDNVTAATMGSFHYDVSNGVTPNVTVRYEGFVPGGGPAELQWWDTGYSDLSKVLEYEADGMPGYRVVLTAASGVVLLDQFDVGNWGSGVTIPSLKVKDGSGTVLYQLDNWFLSGNTFPHQTFVFLPALQAQELSIEFDLTGLGGNSDNVGMDNIRFRQSAVPEPVTFLAVPALAALALRRRKR